jgi:hypothetical protein
MVLLDGNGNGTSGDFTQTVNQHAIAAGKLATFGQRFFTWQATPQIGFGVMKSQGNINDTFTDTQNGSFLIGRPPAQAILFGTTSLFR